MLNAGIAERAKPAERGSEGEEECEDDMRDRRDPGGHRHPPGAATPLPSSERLNSRAKGSLVAGCA